MNREGSNLSWKLEQDIFTHEDNEPISTSPLIELKEKKVQRKEYYFIMPPVQWPLWGSTQVL
jgi:hypothetical protein